MRRILLIEPDYKNKYPPLGLMKISTYHKLLGDRVQFFKGNVNELVVNLRFQQVLDDLKQLDDTYSWESHKAGILKYLKYRKLQLLKEITESFDTPRQHEAKELIRKVAFAKPRPAYDRIYVTTLFTFYWRVTVKAIHQAKNLVSNDSDIQIGGVLASLLYQELIDETGIKPFKGLLDRPGILDPGNKLIIDDLPLDYSILEEIDYEYPTQSAYFTFMTKGCTRKCAFCSVPKLEPTYRDMVPTLSKYKEMTEQHGEPRNLLLMDNNVLASPRFSEIVDEIKRMGFHKGATYVEPNQFEIAYKNLIHGGNDKAYLNRIVKLLIKLHQKRLKGETKADFGKLLLEHRLDRSETAEKENVVEVYPLISRVFEKYRNKVPVARYVDFNQGIDGRYVNEDNMALLAQLNIRPLRIAFDFIGMKKQYINAVELAAKYGIRGLSNYILYNFKDHPDDLYERLKINVDLNKRLGTRIFSFPMKYIPLFGEEAKHRKYVGKHWSPKFIRAIQSVLNSTKGIVAPGSEFFEMAFGKNIEEYHELLYMPETFIVYRVKFQEAGLTDDWRNAFYGLSHEELTEAKTIIEKNNFDEINSLTRNQRVYNLLKFYTIKARMLDGVDLEREKLRTKFNRLIKKDVFLDLTLTYDYDRTYRKPTRVAIG